MTSLQDIPITSLKGVGPRTCQLLQVLNITTVLDLLFHLPLRYEDRTTIKSISQLQPKMSALVEGKILQTSVIGRGRKQLVLRLDDGTGFLTLRFFYFNASQKQALAQLGKMLRCFGEIRHGYQGGLEIMHPEYRFVDQDNPLDVSAHLTPVYPTTKGLSQLTWRRLQTQALALLKDNANHIEILPEEVLCTLQMPTIVEALSYIHHPPKDAPASELVLGQHQTQRRLAFEELLAHQVGLTQLRLSMQTQPAYAIPASKILLTQFNAILPFCLTGAQKRVAEEVYQDLSKPVPMLRLVQGDVGCGKTIVAAMAMLPVIEQGYQVVLMAPTELLALQHLARFTQWLTPLGISVGFLSGNQTQALRKSIQTQIASGQLQVVIGTHALFQEAIAFEKLALMIVDEQHRFGVHQRMALQEKGKQFGFYPHQLIMSATPIPRTLAMAAYADLDYSVIDELPPGRKPITTTILSNAKRSEVIARVRENCQGQDQAYWVCTLIEESELLMCQAAQATAEELSICMPDITIGLVHGRMKAQEKEQVMQAFARGEIRLLVATTVIEVGVDVAQANLMIIENAERLGLAQLHQLRGRVGRGERASYCVLLYQSPLSQTAKARLEIMRKTQNGFEIANEDLTLRGPGEVLGTRQAGEMRMRIANIVRDADMLADIQRVGQKLIKHYPAQSEQLVQRWIKNSDKYARV